MTNPNARILQVPKEYGADDDDNYFGSIGDATQRHVAALSGSERLLWEGLIVTKDGNIWRTYPNLSYAERDVLDLRSLDYQDLLEFAEKNHLATNWIKEEFEKELERRGEDALDYGELIPYSLHEEFPGMTQHIDIPTTPRDRYEYLGNCYQEFYDDFPEKHPDAGAINSILRLMDKDQEEMTEKFISWVHDIIHQSVSRPYVVQILDNMVDLLTDSQNPDEEKITALRDIDYYWSIECKNFAAKKALQDPVFALLIHQEKEWNKAAKAGVNVLPQVKSMGKMLHDEFRDKMRKTHWERYKALKKKFAGSVLLNGLDVNSCSVQMLREKLHISDSQARKIWHSRPFYNLNELYNRGLIGRQAFVTSENLDKATAYIEHQMKVARTNKDKRAPGRIAQTLVSVQKKDPGKLTPEEWKTLWSYYRLCRNEFNQSLQNAA